MISPLRRDERELETSNNCELSLTKSNRIGRERMRGALGCYYCDGELRARRGKRVGDSWEADVEVWNVNGSNGRFSPVLRVCVYTRRFGLKYLPVHYCCFIVVVHENVYLLWNFTHSHP